MGRLTGAPVEAWNASIVSDLAGSDNWDASQGDRKHMPSGILRSQNDMVSPNTRTLTPLAFKCAAAESPYGPAPITTTSGFAFNFEPPYIRLFVIRAVPGTLVLFVVEPAQNSDT